MRNPLIFRVVVLVALGGVLSIWAAPRAEGWDTTCDNCYLGTNNFGEPDAQCCLDGRCDTWQNDPDYYLEKYHMEWCTSWVNEDPPGVFTAGCDGTSNSCTATGGGVGGGGGGGACNIQWGDVCPAECFSCTHYYY